MEDPSSPLHQRRMLPYDIIVDICSFLGTRELTIFALMNRMWNEIATGALYRDIDLFQPRAIWRCVNTLSLPPEEVSFGRNLAVFLHSIHLRRPLIIDVRRESTKALAEILLQTLPRLVNLQAFSCEIPLPHVLRILLWSTETRTTPLRTLELETEVYWGPTVDWTMDDDFGSDVPLERWPTLSSLKLSVALDKITPYATFLKHTICRSPNHLRFLSLFISPRLVNTPNRNSPIKDIVSRLPVFERLEELRTSLPVDLLALPCFAQAPRLKSLCVTFPYGAGCDLRPTDYPALEVLSSPARASWGETRMLDALLPLNLPEGRRRPIHTLRLGNASYERYRGEFRRGVGMLGADVPTALAYMAPSGVPVRHLGIHIAEDIDGLLAPDTKPRLAHLESLEILIAGPLVPELDPLQLGARLIAHMPRLHTFLLSDESHKAQGGPRHAFPWARDEALQRRVLADFDSRSSVLRRVAHTCEFEWERRADGRWHAWGHVVPERPLPPLGEGEETVGLDE